MDDILKPELDRLKDQGLWRSLRTVSSRQAREVVIDGQKVLNFCSNDYLGLAGDQRLVSAADDALRRLGLGSGASRLVCGNFDEHVFLEEDLAAFKKTESALFFSTGYMANVGIISSLVGRDDVVLSDRLNHASILDGIALSRAKLVRYAHNDMNVLEEALKKSAGFRRKIIVTDTVFSMDGDMAPLKEIVQLAEKHDAWLMVDEAHAFGVFGPTGAGLVEELGLGNKVQIQMGTLSKAAGCFGAYCAGSKTLRDYLINHARSFVFTTGMPPAIAAAARAALRIIQAEPERRQKVLRQAEWLRQEFRSLGLDTLKSTTPIIPVLIGEAERAVRFSRELLEKGIFVQAIRPPTVPINTARLRVTVTAAQAPEDLARCVEAFRAVMKKILRRENGKYASV